jgi:hypothetical protein
VNTNAQAWTPASHDDGSLVVGRENTIHLQAGSVACIDRIMAKDPTGKELRVEWSAVKANEVQVNLPLQQAQPGALTLIVSQYGAKEPHAVELRAYPEAGRFESFSIHAGESHGYLKGSRLDDVARLSLKGLEFLPMRAATSTQPATMKQSDALRMEVKPAAVTETSETIHSEPATPITPSAIADSSITPELQQGEQVKATITLHDGRTYAVNVSVAAARPSVQLLGKSVQLAADGQQSNIELASEDQVPQDAQLIFSVRAKSPATFSRDASIEVASEDEAFTTTLSLENRGLTLADAKVAIATFDPAKAFGFSAFGPLKFRLVRTGASGDWQPLATLVRLPELRALQCPPEPEQTCNLTGSNLFLVDSVSADAAFTSAVEVPAGFPGRTLPVPRPLDRGLYLKLRDDPAVVNLAMLVAQTPAPASEAAPDVPPPSAPPEQPAVNQAESETARVGHISPQ